MYRKTSKPVSSIQKNIPDTQVTQDKEEIHPYVIIDRRRGRWCPMRRIVFTILLLLILFLICGCLKKFSK